MPLIIISGLPLSGKSTRAAELEAYFEALKLPAIRKIIVVNEESLGIDKKVAYIDAESEKKTRGTILSAVERHLSREDLVICDYLNYIKGFRYQLYVIARGIGTPSCSVYCGSTTDVSLERNLTLNHYFDQTMLENVCSRFEEPDGRNRWDAPLFLIINSDPSLTAPNNTVASNIMDSVTKKALAPNMSTVVKPIFETNYLSQVEKTLSDVLDTVIQAQKDGRAGDIVVPHTKLSVHLPSNFVSLTEFRKLKRQYIQINKSHTISDMTLLADSFSNEQLRLNSSLIQIYSIITSFLLQS